MLTNLIESRGKEFSNLLKIGDYLARSLRENVELFYVENGKVTYVTESGGVINGNYSFKPTLKLTNIQIDDASVLESEEAFEKVTNKKVSHILSNLLESDYSGAEGSLDDLLSLYETKLSYGRIKERLASKVERFGEQTSIVSSSQFKKVSELKDKLVEFLKSNKDVAKVPEIKNGLKLASVVSKAFNLPKITLEGLAESRTFSVKSGSSESIYEHLCKQELIAKELLEAKQNFDTTWASNELISELASMVYEKKRSKLEEQLAKVINNIPYFALATKKQISTLFENCLSHILESKVSNKDITSYVATIFEMKKPVKTYILKVLNEKYGINVNNLTEVPTFSNLIKTEAVILTSLSRLAPKNSVLKQQLEELAVSLKGKNGAESIDLVDFLNEVFTKAGYKSSINETSLLQYLDFTQVADDLGKIGAILKLLRPVLGGAMGGGAGGGMPSAGGSNPMAALGSALGGMGGGSPTEPMTDGLPGNEDQEDPLQAGLGGDMPVDPMGDAEGAADEVNAEDEGVESLDGGEEGAIPDGDPMGMGMGEDPESMEGEEGGLDPSMDPMGMGEEPEDPVNHVSGDDITALVANIEDLLSSIKSEIGDPDAGGEFGSEFSDEGAEGEFPAEGEESGIPMEGDSDGSSQDGDIDGDGEVEGGDEGEPEEEFEEEEEDPKPKGKFPKK
jgi:hypothetical protein